ncbi:MAG: hypothetical protein IV105_04025 [Rhizobacter sp.]|nr:hypothetical protein [Rhizobacter sp.]
MPVNTFLWLAAVLGGTVIVLQWFFLRARYLNGIAQQRNRHQQAQQLIHQQLDQAKRQIGHLQHELSLSKQQIARLAAKVPAPARPRPMAVPHHQRDEPHSTRRSLPADGFADTLPTPEFPRDAALPQQH